MITAKPHILARRDDSSYERLRVFVRSHVHVRFELTADEFVERVIAVAGPESSAWMAAAERLCLDDLYLATACARADESAWNECASRHFAFVRDFARRILPEPAAGDLADAVIADLWQRDKISRYDGRSTLRTWLGAVTANAALNASAARRRIVSLNESLNRDAGSEPHAADAAFDRGSRETLRLLVTEALKQLDPEEKLLILLHYEQALTLGQMSTLFGVSKATLSRRINRTRALLHDAIDRFARERYGCPADVLRAGVDLAAVELDLESILKDLPDAQQGRSGTV